MMKQPYTFQMTATNDLVLQRVTAIQELRTSIMHITEWNLYKLYEKHKDKTKKTTTLTPQRIY